MWAFIYTLRESYHEVRFQGHAVAEAQTRVARALLYLYIVREGLCNSPTGRSLYTSTHSQVTLNTDPLTKSARDLIKFCPTRLASTF